MKTLRTALLLLVAACGSSSPGGNTGGSDAPVHAIDAPATIVDAPAIIADAPATDRDPAMDGDYAVDSHDATIPLSGNRSTTATTFVPTGAPTPRPLVVVSPGFQMGRAQYTSYARHLATWGFTVVLTDYADQSFFPVHQKLADDLGEIVSWALGQNGLGADAAKIALAGHSLGGKVSILAGTGDARVKAIVAWDPVDAGTPSVTPEKMPTLGAALAVIGETTDGSGGGMPCAPTADNFAQYYAAAASPALAMTVNNADHMDWVDDPTCAFCGFCTAGTAPADRARTATKRLDVAWLRARLLGDAAMQHWLAMPPEVAAGTATVLIK